MTDYFLEKKLIGEFKLILAVLSHPMISQIIEDVKLICESPVCGEKMVQKGDIDKVFLSAKKTLAEMIAVAGVRANLIGKTSDEHEFVMQIDKMFDIKNGRVCKKDGIMHDHQKSEGDTND